MFDSSQAFRKFMGSFYAPFDLPNRGHSMFETISQSLCNAGPLQAK